MPERYPCRLAGLVLWGTLLLLIACSREDGPAPVAWDRTRCDRCGMLVSDPAWAAQRHTASGQVLHYDDPGCLLVASEEAGAADDGEVSYFHHHREDRWLRRDSVSFVEAGPSPMGYGLGAVSSTDAPGALSLMEARDRALVFDRERAGP